MLQRLFISSIFTCRNHLASLKLFSPLCLKLPSVVRINKLRSSELLSRYLWMQFLRRGSANDEGRGWSCEGEKWTQIILHLLTFVRVRGNVLWIHYQQVDVRSKIKGLTFNEISTKSLDFFNLLKTFKNLISFNTNFLVFLKFLFHTKNQTQKYLFYKNFNLNS